MKYLIHLVLTLALLGCDPTPDVTGSAEQDAGNAGILAADEARAAVDVPNDEVTPELAAQVFQFGIYKAERKGRIANSADTNTGKVIRKPVLEHVSMTDRIPLEKDTYFGFQYRLWNLPIEATVKRVMQLRSVLIHPEMTLPDGSRSMGWDRAVKGIVKTQQVIGFDGYAFNEDYELVEGDWIFQIWYQDRKLLERKFVSYHPEPEQQTESAIKE